MNDFFPFERRVKQLPQDEGGSVLLLSGMMAFLVAILGIFIVDTSQAVYKRIIAQNAVDAAAETSALWQARGLNLLQSWNNIHYVYNVGIYAQEWYYLAYCLKVDSDFAKEVSDAAKIITLPRVPGDIRQTQRDCDTCNKAGQANDRQSAVATDILQQQNEIATAFPYIALVYANQVAQASGGDPLNSVLPQYGNQLQGASGIPGLGVVTAIPGAIPVPIYAFPMQLLTTLNMNQVFLNVHEVSGEHWPWKTDQIPFFTVPVYQATVLTVFWLPAAAICALHGHSLSDHFSTSKWGWKDSYYRGYPGYNTWMAGKTNQTELAGLGTLRWLNGQSQTATVHYAFMDQDNMPMYEGSVNGTGPEMMVPAFLAFASSQVEGTGVVAKDTGNIFDQYNVFSLPPVDSLPKLISVFLPSTIAGTDWLILH